MALHKLIPKEYISFILKRFKKVLKRICGRMKRSFNPDNEQTELTEIKISQGRLCERGANRRNGFYNHS